MFEIGDKVICVDASDTAFLLKGHIYTIGSMKPDSLVQIKELVTYYPASRFKLVKEPVSYPTLKGDYESI